MGQSPSPLPTPVPEPAPTKPKPVNYAPEGGSGDPNPYASQTTANTQTGWGGGSQPVSVDIHGLGDYAVDMKNIALFEFANSQNIQLLITGIHKSWTTAGPPLPEADWALLQFQHNAEEFTQYLQNLYDAVNNIAFAAQSVADCYTGTDGWSAADVNSVDFAFGDNVTKPAGWLYSKTDTWLDDQKKNNQGGQNTAGDVWVSTTTTVKGNTTTTVSVNQFGKRQTTVVTTNPDGSSTMVVTGTDGTTTTTSSQTKTVGDTQTTVTKQDGKTTGTTTVVTKDEQAPGGDGTLHVVTTTELNADGTTQQRKVVTTYTGPEGPSTTTAVYGADGTLLSEVTVGASTASAPAGKDQTVQKADNYIDQRNYDFTHPDYSSYYYYG